MELQFCFHAVSIPHQRTCASLVVEVSGLAFPLCVSYTWKPFEPIVSTHRLDMVIEGVYSVGEYQQSIQGSFLVINKTKSMKEAELKHQALLETLIPEMYAEHGTATRVAEVLGISRHTLYVWQYRLGISTERKTTAEPEAASG